MDATQFRVAVAGAGIGGLCLAAALRQRGITADVYEQAPELRTVGVGLHLAPNGTRLLRRLGLTEQLREVAVRPTALEVRGWADDRALVRHPMGELPEAESGAAYYTLHRADLHRMLAGLVPSERIHVGRRLTGFVEDADSVRLMFHDGEVADADVLVGADGMHSVVRAAVAGPDEPVFSGSNAFRALVPAGKLPAEAADTLLVWGGPGGRLLTYPVSAGRMVTVVAVITEPERAVESWSASGDVTDLAKAFADWNATVQRVIGAVAEAGWWGLFDRAPLERWSTPRVTLLGDAAHPMLPHHAQGASQAIEDAVALAVCLADTSCTADESLRRYEAARRPHTTRVQLGSRGSGSLRLGPTGAGPASALPSMVEDVSWIHRYDVERELSQAHIARI